MNGKSSSATKVFAISELNQRLSSKIPTWVLAICVALAAVSVFVLPQAIRGNLNALPPPGDGPDYDAIAYQLNKGNGFSVNWRDPDYRASYQKRNKSGRYDYLLKRDCVGPTAYRPPLLPFMMAVSFRVFGRTLSPVRVLIGICMALACSITVVILFRRFGIFPSLICVAWFLFLDPRFTTHASRIMTEGLACLVVAGITWMLIYLLENRTWKTAMALGAITGIAFFARSVFILWVPVIAIAVYVLAKPGAASSKSLSAFILPSVFLVSFLIVSGPWMVRNCVLLKGFEPLGTMGSVNSFAAYSDKGFKRRGRWFGLSKSGFYDQLDLENKSCIEQERVKANLSRKAAKRWALKNPLKVLLLACYKIENLWKPQGAIESIFLALAILGCVSLLSVHPYEALVMLFLLAACTLSVGLTWTVGGRFLVPVLPILALMASVGGWSLLISSAEPTKAYTVRNRQKNSPTTGRVGGVRSRARPQEKPQQ